MFSYGNFKVIPRSTMLSQQLVMAETKPYVFKDMLKDGQD
jgi:hypothetical protein